jgi:hypothetical protein
MPLLLQDVVVTGMALGAIVVVVRRVVGAVAPARGKAGCAACPSCPSSRTPVRPEPPIQIVARPR